jgi:hypothetical protein
MSSGFIRRRWPLVVAAGWAASSLALASGAIAQQNKGLSDEAVKKYMDFGWELTPNTFTPPDGGKTITVDKTKRKDVMVPLDVARDVIQAGWWSAEAQLCGLAEEQTANFHTMMLRKMAEKKWTDQQLLFMRSLHLYIVMARSGQVEITQTGEDGKTVVTRQKPSRTGPCPEADIKRIKDYVTTYQNAGAPPAAAEAPAAAASAQPAAPAAVPAAAQAPSAAQAVVPAGATGSIKKN